MFTRHEHQNLSLARVVLTRAEFQSLAPHGCNLSLGVLKKIPVSYHDQPQIQINAELASTLPSLSADNIFGVVDLFSVWQRCLAR